MKNNKHLNRLAEIDGLGLDYTFKTALQMAAVIQDYMDSKNIEIWNYEIFRDMLINEVSEDGNIQFKNDIDL